MYYVKYLSKYIILIFFKLLILFQFSLSLAQNKVDRIDLDYRYIISELNEFSKLGFFLKHDKSQERYIKTNNLTLNNKPHEFFIDTYYDSQNFNIYQTKSSLRYRSRFKNSNQPTKNIHYKSLNFDKISYNEFKLKVNKDIKDGTDFVNYLLDTKNKNNDVIINLRKKVNIKNLKYQFTVVQNRDRYYLKNKEGITIYTISLDRTLFKKNNINKMINFVEFEINELIYVSASERERIKLISTLSEIILKIKEKFNIIKINKTKYEAGFDILEIKKNRTYLNIDNILIPFLLFVLLFLAIIVYTKKPKLHQ